ncbi:MAG: N-acetyltransferase [Cyanobacteria bacterium P01_A01_bin.123]
MSFPIDGYQLIQGSTLDRARLIGFMQRTYQELGNGQDTDHLLQTVDQYLSQETPLWWVIAESASNSGNPRTLIPPVACLWLGTAIDQRNGDHHAYLLLLYVLPEHRRRGIGLALMQQAHQWSKARGDRQISLQVFEDNSAALSLYKQLGYQTTARLMHRIWE